MDVPRNVSHGLEDVPCSLHSFEIRLWCSTVLRALGWLAHVECARLDLEKPPETVKDSQHTFQNACNVCDEVLEDRSQGLRGVHCLFKGEDDAGSERVESPLGCDIGIATYRLMAYDNS